MKYVEKLITVILNSWRKTPHIFYDTLAIHQLFYFDFKVNTFYFDFILILYKCKKL